MRLSEPQPRPLPVQLAVALAALAIAGIIAELLYQLAGTSRVSAVFMAAVVVTAVFAGRFAGLAFALVAAFAYELFIEPRFTFELSSETTVNIAVFAAAALLVGEIAGRARDQARRIAHQARVTDLLFEATREFSQAADEVGIWLLLRDFVGRATGCEVCVVVDEQCRPPAPELPEPPPEALPALAGALDLENRGRFHDDADWRACAIVDRRLIGAVAWRGGSVADGEGEQVLKLLIELGAAAISRARVAREQTLLEVVARENEFQDALLSSVSHDFRSPIAAIIGSSQNLLDYETLSAEARQDLARNIHDCGLRLNSFVENVLDYSRIQSGRMRLKLESLDLREPCGAVARRVGAIYPDRRLETAALMPVIARVDPVLLDSVLENLVENALKFCDPGGEVAIATRDEDGHAVIEVVDSGPGVPVEERDLVFEKFQSLAETSGRRGTGLGLAIARAFVEEMGGTIQALPRPDGREGLMMQVRLKRDDAP